MDDFEHGLVADFINNHWHLFLGFMAGHGYDELRCEDLVRALEEQAGRS